ncbi:MAG: hypothetical protein U0X92_12955 [Anaerolineales bacterium]
MMKGQFTLEDWLDQMKQMKKMGPLAQIMSVGLKWGKLRQIDLRDIEKNSARSDHPFDDVERTPTPTS